MALIMNDQMYADIIDHSIEDIIRQTPNDWDILDLYTSSKGKMLPKKIDNYSYQQVDDKTENENVAYIINRQGMEKILFSRNHILFLHINLRIRAFSSVGRAFHS